jgi:nucleotide-binding universal stress UspA family protein
VGWNRGEQVLDMQTEGGPIMAKAKDTSFIVVGVDGSEPSKDALRWAAGQARRTGSDLHAVCAWEFPAAYGWAPDYAGVNLAAEALKALDATIAQVLGDEPDVPLVTRVEQGHAAQVLIDASRGADLLVVGSRGHRAFAGMLLGSVSQHCAQHAACPVVIMRHRLD